jgi:hypothetical protein
MEPRGKRYLSSFASFQSLVLSFVFPLVDWVYKYLWKVPEIEEEQNLRVTFYLRAPRGLFLSELLMEL